MTYSIVLGFHLAAAAVTGIVILFAMYSLFREMSAYYRAAALALGFIAAFEVLSGTALAILSPQLSAAALSLHIVEYLGVCAIAESLLFARMQKLSLAFPLRLAASPVLASVALFVAAISFGF